MALKEKQKYAVWNLAQSKIYDYSKEIEDAERAIREIKEGAKDGFGKMRKDVLKETIKNRKLRIKELKEIQKGVINNININKRRRDYERKTKIS